MSERISREELVRIYNVEITFFDSLEEAGLLKTETENEIKYLHYEQLSVFEKMMTWHYDLDVNLAGLEVIQHLLEKIEFLQNEHRKFYKSNSITE
ncbi:MerR family transcriptional regulator [Chryseobacterium sp. SNU WT5]|uniref:chaperone modulator CbpM n=1 Tax=Chryseobacterium sp. SNU WT5 TaxID=2594269 RepID=UPI00117D3F63|nr:chaperone modulator CbpM [Chryseobacterium sp. SNU WT5]QDP84521.1 MerR family transcriptional regulator [Chryseobacterium sp. SNU WT5]